jgi:hypothetical protein
MCLQSQKVGGIKKGFPSRLAWAENTILSLKLSEQKWARGVFQVVECQPSKRRP